MGLRNRYGLFLKKAKEKFSKRTLKRSRAIIKKAEARGKQLPKNISKTVSEKQKKLAEERKEIRKKEDKFFEKEMFNDRQSQEYKRDSHTAVFKTSEVKRLLRKKQGRL